MLYEIYYNCIIVFVSYVFILDNQNKLFCFDMQGKVEYVIDEHGSGPNEYGNVLDFALNPPR